MRKIVPSVLVLIEMNHSGVANFLRKPPRFACPSNSTLSRHKVQGTCVYRGNQFDSHMCLVYNNQEKRYSLFRNDLSGRN